MELAVLFGIGLYTEHRWKLPTTSRGILTIATLLVPLNFLAIAAVSSSAVPSGGLVIGSELLAPAVFLVLVYYAGRVIAPRCAHLLALGVLGSSVGQLLVRHFASPDTSPSLLIFLSAFPVACYVGTVGLSLRILLSDNEIDETETMTAFAMLGCMSFAALLPFALLLYKVGQLAMTMMYVAPIVTLWGLPMLATGTVMWRRIHDKSLVASRTTGTALGIIGAMIVLAGMFLAWPNPASIVPAALFNCAIFVVLAIVLELPAAHFLAAVCFVIAYAVGFQVIAGNLPWVNLRVASLFDLVISAQSGAAMAVPFVILMLASEWLLRKGRRPDAIYYLVAACATVIVSIDLIVVFAGILPLSLSFVWVAYFVYAAGALWVAWRWNLQWVSWIGSAILLAAFANLLGQSFGLSFPWQTACLVHATAVAILAIVFRSSRQPVLSKPFSASALISMGLAVVCLFQGNQWEVTSMQAQRVFWIAGVCLLLLWTHRHRWLFAALQIAVIAGAILTVKGSLQQFEWYAYLPLAFLRPAALQIQGTVLVLICLGWAGVRLLVRRSSSKRTKTWLTDAWRLLDSRYSIDQALSWVLLAGLSLLVWYGAVFGVGQELSGRLTGFDGFNVAQFAHQEAFGVGSWILIGLTSLLFIVYAWERRANEYVLGAIVSVWLLIPLVAARFESQLATASTVRWSAALFLVLGCLALWNRSRSRLLQRLDNNARTVLFTLALSPMVLLTLYATLRCLFYLPLGTPLSGPFSFLDPSFSYGVPLLVAAALLVIHAQREHSSDYAAIAAAILCGAATASYLLSVAAVGGSMNRVVLVTTIQINAIVLALFVLAWRIFQQTRKATFDASVLLTSITTIAIVLNTLLISPAIATRLLFLPGDSGAGTFAVGSITGWFSLLAVLAAAWAVKKEKVSASELASALAGISCLSALSISAREPLTFSGLHTLTVALTASAWLMFATSFLTSTENLQRLRRYFAFDQRWTATSRVCAAVLAVFAAMISLRPELHDPSGDWWAIAPLFAISALAAALNYVTFKRRYIYFSGITWATAVGVWWLNYYFPQLPSTALFFDVSIMGSCLAGLGFVWLELRSRRHNPQPRSAILSFHNIVIAVSVALFGIILLRPALSPLAVFSSVQEFPLLTWITFASIFGLMLAAVWDARARYAVGGLYLLGPLAMVVALEQLSLNAERQAWVSVIVLSVYAVLTSFAWRQRQKLLAIAAELGVPDRINADASELAWLSVFNSVVAGVVTWLALSISLNFSSFWLRFTAALAVMLQTLTFGFLAQGRHRTAWQRTSIAVSYVGLVLVGWSFLTPHISGTWLNRSVILMTLSLALTGIYAIELTKARELYSDWTGAARSCVAWVLASGVLALFFCLATEVSYQINFGAVRINPIALMVIGLTLAAAAVACVLFALSPAHDPLSLSESRRMNYVYVAELMLALLFMHVRLTMPWLFTGFFQRYWPIAVMAIAYGGVVASESLRRRKVLVLAQPIERTGVFLPLLPVLGFWFARSEVDYSSVLFVVGGLYALVSLLRRSFMFGVLAVIAGNGGLWYLLHHTQDFQFTQHPQLWLVPVALSVLLAAYLNEDDFSEDQLAGIRYLSLVTIYASSTADIFINGVANSPWLPLVLGGFSLAGIFAGIVFRIRGLLLLGSVFLLLSIVTMIWYASANLGWTWLWYVAGIVTGATIIFMFALFEKKRSEVLRVVEGFKEWEV